MTLSLVARNERERLRKLAARRGFKLATADGKYTLTGKLENSRTYDTLAAVNAALTAPAMTTYKACSIAEGFDGGEDATEEQKVAAWQFLIDTGAVNTLQGWFGRTAASLIEQGICKPAPRIEAAAQAA